MQEIPLQPGETVLLATKRHHRSNFLPNLIFPMLALLIIVAAFIIGVTLPDVAPTAIGIGSTLILLCLIGLIRRIYLLRNTRYAVTAERIYSKRGKIWFNVSQTTFDKITDLEITQGPLARTFGYGTIIIQTAGHSVPLHHVPNPIKTKEVIESARTNFLHTLLGEYQDDAPSPETQQPTQLPASTGATTTLYQGKPSPKSMIPLWIRIAITAAIIPILLVIALLTGQYPLIMAAILPVIILIATLTQILARLKYTHFQVTNTGVTTQTGIITRKRAQASWTKITDVSIQQDLFGRILNYGTIRLNTAGSNLAPIIFTGIPEPETIRKLIDEARK